MAELWSLLHYIMPSIFQKHHDFKEWFSRNIEDHAEGKSQKLNSAQLKRLHMILKPFMLRRVFNKI
ncbi:putative DNA helicase ino80, partial [Bonamia ostreae]